MKIIFQRKLDRRGEAKTEIMTAYQAVRFCCKALNFMLQWLALGGPEPATGCPACGIL
jgi:hypothetical protein